jgi:ketosteroid isomerase-like protein
VSIAERYLAAVSDQDWDTVASCITDGIHRVGPFGDVYTGRDSYVEFLRDTMPSLMGYRMDIDRVTHTADEAVTVVELRETVDLDGTPVVTRECIVCEVDGSGLICQVSIYIQRSPADENEPM